MLLQIDGLMGMSALLKSSVTLDPEAVLIPVKKVLRKRYVLYVPNKSKGYSTSISDYANINVHRVPVTLRRVPGTNRYTGVDTRGVYYNALVKGDDVESYTVITTSNESVDMRIVKGNVNG